MKLGRSSQPQRLLPCSFEVPDVGIDDEVVFEASDSEALIISDLAYASDRESFHSVLERDAVCFYDTDHESTRAF